MANGILIVDDAAFMRMMIKDVLSKNGFEISGEAENGAKAIEKYKEINPDLVIMDITMPEVDGIQAVKEIKKNKQCRKGYYVFRHGTAGYGHRSNTSRSKRFYC